MNQNNKCVPRLFRFAAIDRWIELEFLEFENSLDIFLVKRILVLQNATEYSLLGISEHKISQKNP